MLALLEAFWLPVKVAIIHCPGHQKGTLDSRRKQADRTTRLPGPPPLTSCIRDTLCTPDVPRYTLRTSKIRPNARKSTEEMDGCKSPRSVPSYLRSLLNTSSVKFTRPCIWVTQNERNCRKGQNIKYLTWDTWLLHLPDCEPPKPQKGTLEARIRG